MKPVAWWFVVAVLLAAPLAWAEDHSGTWVLDAQELVVDLRQDATGGLSGSVSRKGVRYAIRGKVEAGLAKGLFHDKFAGIFFEARLKGEGLEFVILESVPDSAEYKRIPHLLTRKVEAAVVAGGRIGKMVRHPAGFDLWIPDGWRAEESGAMLRLLPQVAEDELLGTSEVVLVVAIDLGKAPKTHQPDDQRVVHFLDNMALTMSGALRRIAAPAAITTGLRRGTFLKWTTDKVAPKSRRCHAWVTILGRNAVALVASGPGMGLISRTGDLRLVYISLGFDGSGSEPALMRSWSFQSAVRLEPEPMGTTDWSRERTAPDQGCKLTLNADGTFQRVRADGGEQDQGRWITGAGGLYLIRGDDHEVYEYVIEPEEDGMKLRLRVGERGEIWIRE